MVTVVDRGSNDVTWPVVDRRRTRNRPVMLGIVGDSAAGKTTLTNGIVNVFGEDRVTAICVDDYHRYDREARKKMTDPVTPLNPACNYIEIMEQHLKLLAAGEPVLKPVYNHHTGTLDAPELIQPKDFVVIEGLLAYHTKGMRDCFDVKLYLDPPEDLRRHWKVKRDCSKRGYTPEEVAADLARREPDSEAFIRPQREYADIVVRFHPSGPDVAESGALAVRLVLRPTLPHPYLIEIAEQTRIDHYQPLRLMLARDRGKPVDVLEVDGSIPEDISNKIEDVIWDHMHSDGSHVDRAAIGLFNDGNDVLRSESLAVTQLLLVHQLMGARVTA